MSGLAKIALVVCLGTAAWFAVFLIALLIIGTLFP